MAHQDVKLLKTMPDLTDWWSFQGYLDPGQRNTTIEYIDKKANRLVRLTLDVGQFFRAHHEKYMESSFVWYFMPPRADFRPTIVLIVNRWTTISASEYGGRYLTQKVAQDPKVVKEIPRDADDLHYTTIIVKRKTSLSIRESDELYKQNSDTSQITPIGYQQHHVVSMKPKVLVYRVQNRSLIPGFDEPFHPQKILGGPIYVKPKLIATKEYKNKTRIYPTTQSDLRRKLYEISQQSIDREIEFLDDKERRIERHRARNRKMSNRERFPWKVAYIVRHHPRGVLIEHSQGDYEIDIWIEDLYKPAAYSYRFGITGFDVEDHHYFHQVVCAVIHDFNNVSVRYRAKIYPERVFVFAKALPIRAVPEQGVKAIGWENQPFIRVERSQPKTLADLYLQLVIEIGIGFIPIVGYLYDLGQLAYMVKYGEDFFGNEVSPSDIATLGAFCAIGVAFKGSKLLNNLLDSNKFPVDRALLENIAETIDQKVITEAINSGQTVGIAGVHVGNTSLLKMLAGMSNQEQAQLITKLVDQGADLSKNGDSILKTFLATFEELEDGVSLAKSKRASSAKASSTTAKPLKEIVTADGTYFLDRKLADEYLEYLVKGP